MAFSFKIIHFLHFLPLLIFFQCLLQLGFYIFPQLFRFQYRHIRGEALGEVGGGYLVGVDQNGHRFLCFVRKRHILAEQVDHIADQRPTDPEHRPAVAAVIHIKRAFSPVPAPAVRNVPRKQQAVNQQPQFPIGEFPAEVKIRKDVALLQFSGLAAGHPF